MGRAGGTLENRGVGELEAAGPGLPDTEGITGRRPDGPRRGLEGGDPPGCDRVSSGGVEGKNGAAAPAFWGGGSVSATSRTEAARDALTSTHETAAATTAIRPQTQSPSNTVRFDRDLTPLCLGGSLVTQGRGGGERCAHETAI